MHITLNKQLAPGFILYETSRYFLIQTEQKTIPYPSVLSIDRLTAQCQQITQKKFFDHIKTQKPLSKRLIWAIYGIVVVEETPYLALVKSAKHVTSPKQTPIYQVKELTFLRFESDSDKVQSVQEKKVLDFINSQLIEDKFYFYYTEDLTQSIKKEIILGQQSSDPKYFWNQKNLQFFQLNHISKPWLIPIIQGYVGSIQQNQVQYRIIARRSKHMSGTRYNNRGVNIDGFASNYVEIQQRIECKKMIFSFLSLRGSVPVFWKEQGGLYGIEFSQSEERCLKGLKKHYDELTLQYKCTINTINLLSQLKQRQKSLSQRFFKTLTKYGSKTYYKFDFNLSPQTLHSDIQNFIQSYEYKQSKNNFECYNLQTKKRQHQQYFIPRVNCLDCIDRTNVICCRIGQAFVKKVLKLVEVSDSQAFHQKYLNHWKHLGNQISLIYCGTPSVAQHLTLKQQPNYMSSITSSWRSVARFLNANQSDEWKEQCNLYLLREHPNSITTFFRDNIAQYQINPNDYCTFTDLEICIVTWNVGAITPQEVTENDKTLLAQQIFGQKYDKAPGLIFVTLQEIVELNTYNVVSNDNSMAKKKWQSIFLSILKQQNPNSAGFTYALYFSQAMVGVTSFLFAKSSLNHQLDMLYRIKKVFNYQVRRGYGGNLGNKGSIVSGFSIHDTIIINFASHLAAGDDKKDNRLQDVKAAFASLKQEKSRAKIEKYCDCMFFTGDLNFRLSASDEEVRSFLNWARKYQIVDMSTMNANKKKQMLKDLLQKDQLKQISKSQKCLKSFTQPQITFYPTYRYTKNTSDHDIKRKPGWCDRIIYYSRDYCHLQCTKYDSVDKVKVSDHRAVVGYFRIKVKTENKEKKQQLIEDWLAKSSKGGKVIQEPKYGMPKTRYNY